MPELPEVETVRRGLDLMIVGRTITAARATGARTVRASSAAAVEGTAIGRTVTATGRHGKWMWLSLDDEAARLYIHLRMSGQLLWGPSTTAPRPHTHVVLEFDSDELRFVDPRTFGEVVPSIGGSLIAGVARQGPDALMLDPDGWHNVLVGRRAALKSVITDQHCVAGIGNIYADEICFRAGFRPSRLVDTLPKTAAWRLADATTSILSTAIEARGSSLSDEQYVDLLGRPGDFQHQHRVHARAGEPCAKCGTAITGGRLAGRGTYWCGRCQR